MISSMNASGAVEKQKLREKLEKDMKKFKGKITQVESKEDTKVDLRKLVRNKIRQYMKDNSVDIKKVSEDFNINENLLRRLNGMVAPVKDSALKHASQLLGVEK